jgi:hypothetical protein
MKNNQSKIPTTTAPSSPIEENPEVAVCKCGERTIYRTSGAWYHSDNDNCFCDAPASHRIRATPATPVTTQ